MNLSLMSLNFMGWAYRVGFDSNRLGWAEGKWVGPNRLGWA